MGCEVYHALKGLIKAKYGECALASIGQSGSLGVWGSHEKSAACSTGVSCRPAPPDTLESRDVCGTAREGAGGSGGFYSSMHVRCVPTAYVIWWVPNHRPGRLQRG